MTTRPPIDYTSRDATSISEDMKAGIPFYSPEWTYHGASDPGITLLELMSDQLSKLHYYIDRAKQEAFWGTCLERSSMVNLAKIVGYELRGIVPATVDVKFYLAAVHTQAVLIPAGTKLQTKGATVGETPLEFDTAVDVEIPVGDTEVTVGAIQGEAKIQILGQSDGTAYQKFELPDSNVVEDSDSVSIDEGMGYEYWTRIDSFAQADDDDKVYTTTRDEDEIVTINFGDNDQGKIPNPLASIRAGWRIASGLSGNVGAETIAVVLSTIYDDIGGTVTVEVINDVSASGGEDPIDIEDARREGPQFAKTNEVAVALSDYEVLSLGYPGVASATAEEIFSACNCGCTVRITIIPVGGGQPSSVLIDGLTEYLLQRSVMGRECLEVIGATEVPICITGIVYLGENYRTEDVTVAVANAISDYFRVDGAFVKPGVGCKKSDVYCQIDGAEGVDYVELSELTRCPIPIYEIWSGDCEIIVDPSTGLIQGACVDNIEITRCVVPETWTIVFMDATAFSVTGSVSGLQTNLGTIGSPYATDEGCVSFTIVSGQNPPTPGDRATFIVSWKEGSIDVGDDEVFSQGTVELELVGGARTVSPC